MRIGAVENTNRFRENTETNIFITDIEDLSTKANLSDDKKYR